MRHFNALKAVAAVAACALMTAPDASAASLRETIAKSHKIIGEDTWFGAHRIRFDFDGRTAWVVEPAGAPAAGAPWTWTMQWADAYVDRTGVPDLLKRGFRHVTLELFDTRMDAQGLKTAAAFQKYLVDELGFAPMANLLGLSWGGFFSIRYAAAYPQNVRRIYLDAPLLQFGAGFAKGGTPTANAATIGPWAAQTPADGDWLKNPEMPVNMADRIAAARIPVLLLYGGQDQTVNPAANCELFLARFKAAGGNAQVECRGLFGHHPHGVDPDKTGKIIDFFTAPDPWDIPPSKCHTDHFEDGIMSIIHFGLNTFADKEWGYGDTPPSAFNPTRLDTDQWVDAMAAGGIRRVVMVTKHHDGFNLWPSPLNRDYTVANSPWKDGKGDLVKMVSESCRRRGMRFGVYLSPWDRHQASYATPAYVDYFHEQFEDLFANYGKISEIWLDGANGGDGWYGGAKESRKLSVPAWDYYRMPELLDRMHELYPDAIAFGGHGPNSSVWVGNEAGLAPTSVVYVTERGHWETPECDFPLRRGWFWHAMDAPKSLFELVETYFHSVGRGCVMNIGIAPNKDGLVGDDDVKRLKELGDYVREFNAVDYARGATVRRTANSVEVELAAPATVNAVDAMEDITKGQKVYAWRFECEKDGKWTTLVESATIGYRRIERFAETTARRFRVVLTDARPGAFVRSVALRHAPAVPKEANAVPFRKYYVNRGVEVSVMSGAAANEFVAKWRIPATVSGFKFDPRHNLGNLPDKWELRVSEDGRSWSEVIASGEFGNLAANPVEQFAEFAKPLVNVRYVKLTATHAAKGAAAFNVAHENAILFW